MIQKEFSCDLAKEVLTIISYCEDSFISSIPKEILVSLSDIAADSKKEYFVDKNKTLIEQDMSEECRDFIASLFYMYSK